MRKIYNKNQKKLQSLFDIAETVEVISNIQMFKNIQTCLIVVYIISLDFRVLSLMVCYLLLFHFSSKIYRKYIETKNNLLNRYSELSYLISQEFRDGRKLTEWQNERDFITELLVQKKLMERKLSF
ncbi:MAG: hypothetical protein PHR61_03990 [Candidatus Absconditabacteria bacterium]|nr:hypothetical protein [Candidatus Absconditabacteria bacterium]